jgi:hypothetical protein
MAAAPEGPTWQTTAPALLEFLSAREHLSPVGLASDIEKNYVVIAVSDLPAVSRQHGGLTARRPIGEDGRLDLSVADQIADTSIIDDVLALVAIIRWRHARPAPDPALVDALTPIVRSALGKPIGDSVGPVNVAELVQELALSGRIAVRDTP